MEGGLGIFLLLDTLLEGGSYNTMRSLFCLKAHVLLDSVD